MKTQITVIAWALLNCVAVAQQIKTADELALNLQQNFEQNGYDVSVRANHQHELILTSDSFQDVSTREAAVSGLSVQFELQVLSGR